MSCKKNNPIQISILVLAFLFVANFQPQLLAKEQKNVKEIFKLSLEELWNAEIDTGTLTGMEYSKVPAAVTKITQEQIELSGSRSITELLDIYVPNIQVMKHSFARSHIGIRGIIGDTENKYLLLVNGRVMNALTYAEVGSERDLSMLGDIHHIDIVRGPGSVVYGPGAVAGVINIVTHESRTFDIEMQPLLHQHPSSPGYPIE